MLNHFYELFVNLNVIFLHILAVFEGNLNAEFVQLSLLVLVELAMLKGRIVLLELGK